MPKHKKKVKASISINSCTNWVTQFSPLTKVNKSIRNNKFADSLQPSYIPPVSKKLDPSGKANYRPVSVLPLLSKIFEKII